MPIYQYRCRECGGEHSEFRLSTQAHNPGVCPSCGGATQKRFLPGAITLQVPQKFRGHVNVTGLKDDLGSGPGLDVNGGKPRTSCAAARRIGEGSSPCPAH